MASRVPFSVCLITDRHLVPPGHTLLSAIEAALRGGVCAVQLREKDLTAGDLLPLAMEMRALTRDYQARLLINDRVDVALACGADGVHLGERSLPADIVRQILGPRPLIGVSTHSLQGALAAAARSADFMTYGPVFATPSKLAYGPPKGLAALKAVCGRVPLPVYALGGIQSAHQESIRAAGAAGVALISAILAAPDPQAAARGFNLSSHQSSIE